MSESPPDSDFWGPPAGFPEPLWPSEPSEPSEPMLDLPQAATGSGLDLPDPILDLPEAPTPPGLDLPQPILDLPEPQFDPSARIDEPSQSMAIDLPEADHRRDPDAFAPVVIDLWAPADASEADDESEWARIAAPPTEPVAGPAFAALDLDLPDSVPVRSAAQLDLSLPPVVPASESLDLPVSAGIDARAVTTAPPPRPRPAPVVAPRRASRPRSSASRGPAGGSPWRARARQEGAPKLIAAGVAAVAVLVVGIAVMRSANTGPGGDSSHLVSSPPGAVPRPTTTIGRSAAPLPAPGVLSNPVAAVGGGGSSGPPAPATPVSAGPSAGQSGTGTSGVAPAAPRSPSAVSPSAPASGGGQPSAPPAPPPPSERPPFDVGNLPPPPPPPPPPVTSPPVTSPPVTSPPVTTPPSHGDVCRNVPLEKLAECRAAVGG